MTVGSFATSCELDSTFVGITCVARDSIPNDRRRSLDEGFKHEENNVESDPLVTIVTPFYNTREYLEDCIKSVLHQTYENWEYVLVDNCSTDGSSELPSEYASMFRSRIRLIRTKSFLSPSTSAP